MGGGRDRTKPDKPRGTTVTPLIAEHDPDPPAAADPLPAPPSLTDEEFAEFLDVIDRGFGAFADRAYDVLRTAELIG